MTSFNAPIGPSRSIIIAAAGLVALAGTPAIAAVQATGDTELTATSSGPPSADELAKKLANPIAAMISVPFQNNFDWGAGPGGDGFQWKMNVQPVIPISLNETWNLITRTILPVIYQDDIAGTPVSKSGSQFGLGDTSVSAWFSPVKPTSSGWIWGAGPILLLPTGTDDLLGGGQWGTGPTGIALKQDGKWTYGALVSHLWGIAGDSDRADLNLTYMQPFLSYNPGGGWTYALNTESSYNWEAEQWTVPFNLMVSKMVMISNAPVQFQLGGRYYAEAPEQGPEWGLRFAIILLFPK